MVTKINMDVIPDVTTTTLKNYNICHKPRIPKTIVTAHVAVQNFGALFFKIRLLFHTKKNTQQNITKTF